MASARIAATSKRNRSTTTSSATTSSSAGTARASSGKRKAKRKPSNDLSKHQFCPDCLQLLVPFIELFADVDDVFSEDDALAPEKRQMGMGRLYRAWKKARAKLDPDFDAKRRTRR